MPYFLLHGCSIALFVSFISGCGASGPSNRDSVDESLSLAIRECLERESAIVAPQKVDLETAAQAVIARCSRETNAQEQILLDKYRGYHDHIRPKLRELQQTRLQNVRSMIALARTSAR